MNFGDNYIIGATHTLPHIHMRYLLILAVLFSSCSSDWHIKRAIRKDPTIISKAIVKYHKDTVTVIYDGAKGDTTFIYRDAARDTFIFDRPEFRTVVVRDTLWKRMWVETECFPDTITKVVTVTEYVMQPVIDEMNWWERWQKKLGGFVVVLFLLLILVVIIRYTLKKIP